MYIFLKDGEYSGKLPPRPAYPEYPESGPSLRERERPFRVRTGCCLRLKVDFIIVFVFQLAVERKLCSCVPIVLFMCSNQVHPESSAPPGQPGVLQDSL